MAYDAIEPIGGLRGDWQAASICAQVMNAAALIRTGKVRLDFKAKDFLLAFKDSLEAKKEEQPITKEQPKAEVPSWQRMKMIARMHVALSNADEARKKRAAERQARPKRKR